MSSFSLTTILIPVLVVFGLGALAVLIVLNKKNKE
jgi:hypothetical protein